MRGDCFLDTCILLYALAQKDHRETVAQGLLAEGGKISIQVLNEFASAARRKFHLTFEEISQLSAASRALCGPPLPLTLQTHERALDIAQRYGFHFYDSLIVASALDAVCSILYTEDLQHHQQIGGLTIVNPF
jgi:predicted nucleic acid-binding protein